MNSLLIFLFLIKLCAQINIFQKKFSFNKLKSTIIKIRTNKKTREPPKVYISQGEIELTKKEKYLGEWITEKGNNKMKIEKRGEKIMYMTSEIKRYGSKKEVGDMDMEVILHIFETIIIPQITYNIDI